MYSTGLGSSGVVCVEAPRGARAEGGAGGQAGATWSALVDTRQRNTPRYTYEAMYMYKRKRIRRRTSGAKVALQDTAYHS